MRYVSDMLYYEIERLIHKYRFVPHVEIEVRFGWTGDGTTGFDTNIRDRYFLPLSTMLRDANGSSFEAHTRSHTTVYRDLVSGARMIDSNDPQCIQISHFKTKLETVDACLEGTPFDVRIAVSVETPVTNFSAPPQWVPTRKRTRDTYRYKLWNYDLTSSVYYEPVNDTVNVYEFEIELDCVKANMLRANPGYLADSLCMKIRDIAQMKLADCELIYLKKCSLLGKNHHNHRQYINNHGSHSLQKL